jgi:hypothetical protein
VRQKKAIVYRVQNMESAQKGRLLFILVPKDRMAVEMLQFVKNVKKVTCALVDIGLNVRLVNTLLVDDMNVFGAMLVINVKMELYSLVMRVTIAFKNIMPAPL